jgi:hypothetical protein
MMKKEITIITTNFIAHALHVVHIVQMKPIVGYVYVAILSIECIAVSHEYIKIGK